MPFYSQLLRMQNDLATHAFWPAFFEIVKRNSAVTFGRFHLDRAKTQLACGIGKAPHYEKIDFPRMKRSLLSSSEGITIISAFLRIDISDPVST